MFLPSELMAIQGMANETHQPLVNLITFSYICFNSTTAIFYKQIAYCHSHDVGQLSSTRLCYQSK